MLIKRGLSNTLFEKREKEKKNECVLHTKIKLKLLKNKFLAQIKEIKKIYEQWKDNELIKRRLSNILFKKRKMNVFPHTKIKLKLSKNKFLGSLILLKKIV